MTAIYPQSMLCRFEGFPSRIQVVCGPAFSKVRGTPYSFGSRVRLSQTPKSGLLQGNLVAGQALPTLEIIHSDTGDDTTFSLKTAHYGYGRFYLAAVGDAHYTLAVVKGLRIEATGIYRSFETVDVWNTLIPAAADLSSPGTVPDAVWSQDADAQTADTVTWYGGTSATGSLTISGVIQLAGDVSIAL